MKSFNSVPARLFNLFLILILLPLYGMLLFDPDKGLVWAVVRWGELLVSIQILVAATLFVTVGSLFLLGRTREYIFCMFFLFLILYPFVQSRLNLPEDPPAQVLVLGTELPNRGVDVYCNDVYLGKTPLRIPKQEFMEKVPKWETPPAQPMVQLREDMQRKTSFPAPKWETPPAQPEAGVIDGMHRSQNEVDFIDAKYYYYPSQPFTMKHSFNQPWPGQQRNSPFLEGQYFWHVEKNGCVGLIGNDIFNSYYGDDRETFYQGSMTIHYPCLEPVMRMLLLDLRRNGGQPTPEWIAFVEKHLDFLFYELLKHSETETAMKDVVHRRYTIPDAANEQDAVRVMDAVLAKVEKEKAFVIPSPESLAIDLLGPTVETYTAIAYPKYLDHLLGGMSRTGGTIGNRINLMVCSLSNRPNAPLPLEYAIRKYTPDALYDDLVYAYSQSQFYFQDHYLALLSYYDKPRLEEQIHEHFQKRVRSNPDLTLFNFKSRMIRYCFGEFAQTNQVFSIRYVRQLVESPSKEPDETADLVYRLSSQISHTHERDTIQYLIRIPSKDIPRLLKERLHVEEVEVLRDEAIRSLTIWPNPFLDQFLIDSYFFYLSNKEHNGLLLNALLRCDTPASREFVRKIWREDQTVRRQCLEVMRNMGEHPHILKQYLDEVAGVMEPELQVLAAQVLGIMSTPEAMEKLPAFLESTSEEVRAAAQKELEEYEKRIRVTNDLLTGKIEMDDLAEPLPSFAWQGEGYVRN